MVLALCLTTVMAAIPVTADFESGVLFPPWDPGTGVGAPDVTLQVSMAAAHRGSFGARINDFNAASGEGVQSALVETFTARSGDFYIRSWVRLTGSGAGADQFELFDISASPGVNSIAGVFLSVPGYALELKGPDRTGQSSSASSEKQLMDGAWHLVELGVLDVGTTHGGRRLWLDGELIASTNQIDWSGLQMDEFRVGEPWATSGAFTGSLDFDDVRALDVPPASRVSIHLNAEGPCVPVEVSLSNSSGHPAGAPYDLEVTLAVEGEGRFSSDAACTSTIDSVDLALEKENAIVYFEARGPARLRATHPDLLSVPLEVGGPAGTGRDPRSLYQAWGCSTVGGLHLGALALSLVVWAGGAVQRRRRR